MLKYKGMKREKKKVTEQMHRDF